MTEIHSLTIEPKSSWITPLQADTIFGHLCWKIAQNEGKDKLEEFLKEMKNKPFFVVSNGFPCGYIPRPRLEFEFKKEEKGGKKEMGAEFDRIKKYTKDINFIKTGDLKKYFFKFSEIADMNIGEEEKAEEAKKRMDEITEEMSNRSKKKDCPPQSFKKDREIKTTINRFTANTLEEQGPYSLPYFHFDKDFDRDLWILMKVLDERFEEFDKKINIKENLKKVFTEGYGKRKSVGKGVFEIKKDKDRKQEWEKTDTEENQNGKYHLLLSNFIPDKKDSTDGFYEIFVKYGKLGEEKSIADSGNFYKKPLIMIKEGATFKIDNRNDQEYFGRMLEGKEILPYYDSNKSKEDNEICHYAYGFSLRF